MIIVVVNTPVCIHAQFDKLQSKYSERYQLPTKELAKVCKWI